MRIISKLLNQLLKKFDYAVLKRSEHLPNLRISKIREKLINDSDLVIDVGANIGDWAADVRNYYSGEIISIEPIPEIFRQLKRRFSNDPNWKGLNIAISNSKKLINLNVASNDGGSSSQFNLHRNHKVASPDIHFVKKINIEAVKLSKLIKNKKQIYIKADIQGSELDLLKSIKNSDFDFIKAIELEVSWNETYINAPLADEIFVFLRGKGFVPIWMEPSYSLRKFENILQSDVIFSRKVA